MKTKKVRSQYDADKEIWYFSIVNIVGILTKQPTVDRARNYWKVLKSRLKKEGNESVTNCNRLKLEAEAGKLRLTDVGNVEVFSGLFNLSLHPKQNLFFPLSLLQGTQQINVNKTKSRNHLIVKSCWVVYAPAQRAEQ